LGPSDYATTPLSRTFGPSSNNPRAFVVRDHDGQALACIYYEDEPGRRSAAKLLSKDEARRIKLPESPQPH
jgi:hypothetical protein